MTQIVHVDSDVSTTFDHKFLMLRGFFAELYHKLTFPGVALVVGSRNQLHQKLFQSKKINDSLKYIVRVAEPKSRAPLNGALEDVWKLQSAAIIACVLPKKLPTLT